MAQNWKELHDLAVDERRMLNDRIANVSQYDGALNQLNIPPNGDDYNAVIEMLRGAPYRAPRETGR